MEFVLLVLVCFLCICPKAKEASYSVAYPLVGYGTILVTIQYIYGMLTSEIFPFYSFSNITKLRMYLFQTR